MEITYIIADHVNPSKAHAVILNGLPLEAIKINFFWNPLVMDGTRKMSYSETW